MDAFSQLYGAFLWPSDTGPRYAQGFGTTAAFVGLLAIGAEIFRYLQAKYPFAPMEKSTAELDDGRIVMDKHGDHPAPTV